MEICRRSCSVSQYPMFFVGGSSTWAFGELMRGEHYKHWDKAIRENHHTKKASAVISQMKCLSSASSARGVYVSAEQLTKAITAIHGTSSQPTRSCGTGQNWSMCKKEAVPVLSPHVVAKQCPGVRCDGVHFGSAFEDKGCTRSAFLFDRPSSYDILPV